MSKTPRTDAVIAKHSGILQYADLLRYCQDMTANSEQLETELADMREMFKEYIQAENEWRASMFCEMHELNAARENVLVLQKKAKEVLGL